MSDAANNSAPNAQLGTAGLEPSPGAMLRAAREKRGLHIAALAASIKVAPRKLEALEADRYAELPDMTFTRALAQTVCRALKVDAEPVLAKLPQGGDLSRLAHVANGINTPFRTTAAGRDANETTLLRRPVFWATLLVLAGALALAFLPERFMPWHRASVTPAIVTATAPVLPAALRKAAGPDDGAPLAVAVAPSAMATPLASVSLPPPGTDGSALIETVHSAPSLDSSAGGATAGVLAVRTHSESWVVVQDARGQTLLSRTVQPGETVGLDGNLPLRLTIGNAGATQITFRGQPVDLAPSTRDNIARLQLPAR